MFVDASAIVAILVDEPERVSLRNRLDSAEIVLVSALSLYEATTALMRIGRSSLRAATSLIDRFTAATHARTVPIDAEVGIQALEAFERFGKGRHRAALNFGDCFAYACAKVHGVPLLCKGADFKLTDITLA